MKTFPQKETQQSDSKAPLLIDVTLHREAHGQHIGPLEKMNFAPALIPCSCSRKGFIDWRGKAPKWNCFWGATLGKEPLIFSTQGIKRLMQTSAKQCWRVQASEVEGQTPQYLRQQATDAFKNTNNTKEPDLVKQKGPQLSFHFGSCPHMFLGMFCLGRKETWLSAD